MVDAHKSQQDELTSEEIDEVLRILGEKGVKNTCELCHQNSLALSHFVLTPMPLRKGVDGGPGGLHLAGAQVMPSVTLLCKNCGNTKLINLLVLGVREAAAPAKKLEGDDAA